MKDIDPMLIDYLLGAASPEDCVVFEKRLEDDVVLRQQLQEMQEVVVHHAPNVEPLNSNVKSMILTSVSDKTRYFGFTDRLAALFDLPRSTVTELLQSAIGFPAAPWGPSLIPDMHALHFDGGEKLKGIECGLVHLKPGVQFPNHEHEGDEVSFILEGELTDHTGHVFLPGDTIHCIKGQSHSFTSTGDVPLVFAVYHNGLVIDP